MDYATSLDPTLLALVARGDRRAFEALYERYAGHVFGLALRVLQAQAAAQEVTLETFSQVWQRAGQFSTTSGSSVLAWLLMITHRLSIDCIRGPGVQLATAGMPAPGTANAPQAPIPGVVAERARSGPSGDSALDDAAVLAHPFSTLTSVQAHEAVLRLDEQYRRVIELAVFEGKTLSDIAKQLRQPYDTVELCALRGMRALKASLRLE